MKNYNKILEAINRGIQLALDDFDDEEQVLHVKSKQVLNRDYTKEYLDLMKADVVDLGLPSGTLWCKYNLGATCEPNNNKSWFGNYYAWGEIESKLRFNWDNYKYGKDYNKLTKYCNDSEYGLNGFTDNLIELQSEDDIACQNKKLHNFKFHIPTKELCEELINYTKNYWINNYDPSKIIHNQEDDKGIKELNGRVFVGKNGNQLFIPATGYSFSSFFQQVSFTCSIWASSLDLGSPYFAYYLRFNSYNISMNNSNRYFGYCVRPVVNL